MRRTRQPRRAPLVLAGLIAACALFALPSTASAQFMKDFADRCPVDDPIMFNYPNVEGSQACFASNSTHGTFRIRNTTVNTGNTNVQFGAMNPEGTTDPVDPVGLTLSADPVKVPGGVLNLKCNPNAPGGADLGQVLVHNTCKALQSGPLEVRTKVELAGEATDFNIFATLEPNTGSVLTLPVRIRIINPLLGPTCYIGSKGNPVVLKPVTTDIGDALAIFGDPDDPDVFAIRAGPGGQQVDDAFSVPRAHGCGPKIGSTHLLNSAINDRLGLPSPSGQNELVLDDVTNYVVGVNGNGMVLSQNWHEAND